MALSNALFGVRDDLRSSLRALRREKAYAVTAVLTLALGIGATTAVFAVIDATLVRPLPSHITTACTRVSWRAAANPRGASGCRVAR